MALPLFGPFRSTLKPFRMSLCEASEVVLRSWIAESFVCHSGSGRYRVSERSTV